MERSILLAEDGTLSYDCLCMEICSPGPQRDTSVVHLSHAVEQAEKTAILNAMRAANNNRSEAARLLASAAAPSMTSSPVWPPLTLSPGWSLKNALV